MQGTVPNVMNASGMHSDIIFKPPKQLTHEPAVCTGTTGRQMAPKIHQHQC